MDEEINLQGNQEFRSERTCADAIVIISQIKENPLKCNHLNS